MTQTYSLPPLSDISSAIQTQEGALEYLISHDIIEQQRVCTCGTILTPSLKRATFRCSASSCRSEKSVFSGTFFASAKIPCNKVLEIAYYWLAKASTKQITTYTGISAKTVIHYIHHLQQLTADTLESEDFIVGGDGIVVEVDETKIGKRKYNRGHRVDGVWIFCAVERTPDRKVYVQRLENRNSNTLTKMILDHVRPKSIIITDCWKGYSDISERDYYHLTVNHSIEFMDSETFACTNSVEGNNNALKMLLPPRKRTVECEDSLWEFIWRRKHEIRLWDSFIDALKIIAYT
jgi:transposase-like protein